MGQALKSTPNSWADVLTGAQTHQAAATESRRAISLAPEHNCEQTLRSIMYSFGASEQDADGHPTLKSQATLESLKYVKDLLRAGDDAGRAHLGRSVQQPLHADRRGLLHGGQPVDRPRRRGDEAADSRTTCGWRRCRKDPRPALAPSGSTPTSIWKFAENPEGAKQFLVDYVGRSRDAFLASGFQNMPCYPETVPDLATLTAGEPAMGRAASTRS